MNRDQHTLQKALKALTKQQFLNVYEWVGNGHPLLTGSAVRCEFVVDGEP